MLEIQYTPDTTESANATFDFLINRPMMRIIFSGMRFSCMLLSLIFMVAWYHKALRAEDTAALIFALIWFFYYKKINRLIIRNALKLRKFDTQSCLYKIDDKSIFYKLQNYNPQDIKWKSLKYVLKNKDGYIIPLTGFGNAGRFLWLPLRSLNQNGAEQQFLDLIAKFKLKLRQV